MVDRKQVKGNAFTATGAISPVIVNVYSNWSVYINGCYNATPNWIRYSKPLINKVENVQRTEARWTCMRWRRRDA